MGDKRYWHPNLREPAFQHRVTDGFRRLYPSGEAPQAEAGSGGPVHVDAHSRRSGQGSSEVRQHYRARPGEGGGTRRPLPPPGDAIDPAELYRILDFDANGMDEEAFAAQHSIASGLARALGAKNYFGSLYDIPGYRIQPGNPHNNEDDAVRHALWS